MEFKRKQRIKGKKAKHYKEWYSLDGHYRISWRNQYEGSSVDPAYYACVRCLRGESKYWNFAGRRGTHRTLNAAEKACEQNKQIWDKFLAIEGNTRQFKEIQTDAFWITNTNSTMWNIPVWVLAQASTQLLAILCSKNPSDPIETSPSSLTVSKSTTGDSSREQQQSNIPVLSVKDAEKSTSATPSREDAAL